MRRVAFLCFRLTIRDTCKSPLARAPSHRLVEVRAGSPALVKLLRERTRGGLVAAGTSIPAARSSAHVAHPHSNGPSR